ncbi:disks large-associated protein 5 isoform X2 [Ochotona curzoniae]|uniref:disks large-associated protein 5 isoform X2 n=1 Tax=Ochotona curzoniae TaxID=130825 RepID=UPI001B34DFB7|nr:disks large-associated protein 5 isoform X2 [Ochotona curzoniae]
MSSSLFASRHRKDLSTEMIRTKLAHRKSLSQKENRHKEYERNRHFGLKDVNIPTWEGRTLVELEESSQDLVPEKSIVKPRSMKTVLGDQRRQMLQKYKEEKQLQKLKEQREKAKRGVFKVGLYRPVNPGFLSSNQNAMKTEPKKAIPPSRITRSKAKEEMEQPKIANGSTARAVQPGQKPASEKKVLDKERAVVRSALPISMRMTRSATQVAKQVVKTVSATTRKPGARAANDNEPEKKAPNKGIPAKSTETNPGKVISLKVDNTENILDAQNSTTNGMDQDEVLSKMENVPKTNLARTKGKVSFAPKDFMFQPLDGLKTYQVKPMTPRSANAFLTPSYIWTPLEAKVDKTEAAKENLAQKCGTCSVKSVHQDSASSQCPLGSLTGLNEDHVSNQKEATTQNSNDLPIKEVSSLDISGPISQPQHDVPYFRNILQSETEKLTSRCLEWDRKLELEIPEDAKDLIRTTVGQTRLLMKERFKQFEGLVNDCEYKRGEKETTCTDLDGFWDMVNFQIEDVNQKFNNLTKLEESGWQNTNNNASKKVSRQKAVPKVTVKPKQDDSGKIAAKNRLAAIKNAMRARIKQAERGEATASVMPTEVDTIVFDAGFFRIESPIKSFSGLSISSDRNSERLGTPRYVSKAGSQSRADTNLTQAVSAEDPASQATSQDHAEERNTVSLPRSPTLIEDSQCPGAQGFVEGNHDVNKINLEVDSLSRISLPLHVGEGADDINANRKEEMKVNAPAVLQDILMTSPEKIMPSLNNMSPEETQASHSVLFDNGSLTTEHYLLDSPGMNCGHLYTPMERRPLDHGRHVSFGGNLIAFSPLRPVGAEQPEELRVQK